MQGLTLRAEQAGRMRGVQRAGEPQLGQGGAAQGRDPNRPEDQPGLQERGTQALGSDHTSSQQVPPTAAGHLQGRPRVTVPVGAPGQQPSGGRHSVQFQ